MMEDEANVVELKSSSGKVIVCVHPFPPGEAPTVLTELKSMREGFDEMIAHLEKRVEQDRIAGLMEPVVSLDEYRARKAARSK